MLTLPPRVLSPEATRSATPADTEQPRTLRRLSSAFAAILLATVALLVPALPASAAESDTIFSLLNSARSANGQNTLVRNSALDTVAANWAAQLSAAGVLSHNPNYSGQIPAGWSRAGENVARGQMDANQVHSEWMASPGHRANILGDYTDVGVAWLVDSSGMTWGVQVFANYPAAVTAAPAATSSLDTLALPDSAADAAAAEEPVAVTLAKSVEKDVSQAYEPVTSAEPVTAAEPAVADSPASWSPFVLLGGVLLVAAAGAQTIVRRRGYLLAR